MQIQNPVSGRNVVIMSNSFGWLELTHEGKITGYIYVSLEDPLPPDRIGGRNRSPYVVMHQRFESLPVLLHILEHEPALTIRLDEETGGDAFLESNNAARISAQAEDPRPAPAR